MTRTRAPGASSFGGLEPMRAWNAPQSSASHPSFAGCRTPPSRSMSRTRLNALLRRLWSLCFSPLPRARRYRHRGRTRRRALERAQGTARLRLAAAPGSFAAAIVLFAVAPFVQAFSFWLMLRLLGLEARLSEALLLWMRSFLLRYAPSGALALVIRIRERRRFAASTQDRSARQRLREPRGAVRGRLRLRRRFRPRRRLAAAARDRDRRRRARLGRRSAAGVLRRWARALLARRGLDFPSLLRGDNWRS